MMWKAINVDVDRSEIFSRKTSHHTAAMRDEDFQFLFLFFLPKKSHSNKLGLHFKKIFLLKKSHSNKLGLHFKNIFTQKSHSNKLGLHFKKI